MAPDELPDDIALDRVYAEYVRLGGICNDYIKNALGDIRLFGAIGALLVWDPLSRLLELDARLQQPVTPVGFLVLLLVTVLVMFYDLLKQSIFFFHLSRLRELERVLNRELGDQGALYHLAGGWPDWFRRHHAPVARGFWVSSISWWWPSRRPCCSCKATLPGCSSTWRAPCCCWDSTPGAPSRCCAPWAINLAIKESILIALIVARTTLAQLRGSARGAGARRPDGRRRHVPVPRFTRHECLLD